MARRTVVVNAGPRMGWNTDWPWTMSNAQAKQKRHETVFPKGLKAAFKAGAKLAG